MLACNKDGLASLSATQESVSRGIFIDRIGFAANEPTTQRIGCNIYNRIIIHRVQADGAITAAGIDPYSLGIARTADTADGCAGNASGCQHKVSDIHTSNGYRESNGEIHAGKISGISSSSYT
jgi:hypothetical protein